MKLLQFLKSPFSGQTYSQAQQPISTIASKNVACYRGQLYNLPPAIDLQFQGLECQMSATIFKYRRVSYAKTRYHSVREPATSSQFQGSECQMSATIFKYRRVSYAKTRYQFPE